MAFGKRVRSEVLPAASSRNTANVPVTSPSFLERAQVLKEHVDRMLVEATQLAAMIKAGDIVPSSGYDAGFDPETHPISIAGFSRHFNFLADGRLKHGVYAFLDETQKFDQRGQLVFLELGTAVMRLNAMCWSAHHEGALTMALQSAAGRVDVDRIVVLSGYLSCMLEITIAGMSTPRMVLAADTAKQRVLDWGDRALRVMIEPATFDNHYPDVGWPAWLVEIEIEDHEGQLVVNNVYLPSEIAKPVVAAMAREQTRAFAAA